MSNYQQTDVTKLSECTGIQTSGNSWVISAGAAAGTVSHSNQLASAGGAGLKAVFFTTPFGDPGTATWIGACVVRFNLTTANANAQWIAIHACEFCGGGTSTAITSTSGLGISLGTTGVKTASVEITAAYSLLKCNTATAGIALMMSLSNAGTMAVTINYLSDQIVTLPFTASAAPAPSAIFTLAQLGAGN